MGDGSVYGQLAESREPPLFRIVPDKHDQIVNGEAARVHYFFEMIRPRFRWEPGAMAIRRVWI